MFEEGEEDWKKERAALREENEKLRAENERLKNDFYPKMRF